MKKLISLVLAMLLCLTALPVLAESNDEWDSALFDELSDKYASALSLYSQVINERWDKGMLYDHDLCPLLSDLYNEHSENEKAGSNIRYGFAQLGGTADYQLVFFLSDDESPMDVLQIFDLAADGSVVTVATAGERWGYRLCKAEDGSATTIVCTGSSSAFEAFTFNYTVKEGALKVINGIMMVWDENDEGTLYLCTDEDFDTSNDTKMDWSYADEYLDELYVREITGLDLWATMADYISAH